MQKEEEGDLDAVKKVAFIPCQLSNDLNLFLQSHALENNF